MRRLLLSVLCLGLSAPCSLAAAEAPPATLATPNDGELSARLATLRKQPQAEAVRAPIEQAALALSRAEQALRQHEEATRQRCLQLAHAALTLAEARTRLSAERALYERAEARQKAAKKRAEEAQALLSRSETEASVKPSQTP